MIGPFQDLRHAVRQLRLAPAFALVAIASLEGSRVNDFAFWRAFEARVGELLPRRSAMKAPAPAEERIETVP